MTAPRFSVRAVLRRLAMLSIRGHEAPFVLRDLDDALQHDLDSGIPTRRAHWRYATNVVGSAMAMWRARGLRVYLPISRLDVKTGVRMLVKHPSLSLVAAATLTLGIPTGLAPFHVFNALEAPLPVEDGDQIRLLRYWNTATSGTDRTTMYDYDRWRGAMTSFQTLGAFRTGAFNVLVEGERVAPSSGAEATASAFEILRTRPLLGRTLQPADEDVDAPAVVVIGHTFWQSRLAGDPDVLQRTLQIGDRAHRIVGVMPDSFRFPVQHQLWLPLRENPAQEPRHGRALNIFGRLAAGTDATTAEAELLAIDGPMATQFPEAHARLRAEVTPFALLAFGLAKSGMRGQPDFYVAQLLTLVLLSVACANVGMLMFARNSNRATELAIRTALGAARSRIVGQMFVESLVLAVLAAGFGLLLIDQALSPLMHRLADGQLPYWVDLSVTPWTASWAFALAVFSAAGVGVVPALKLTGQGIRANIERSRSQRTGTRYGGVSGVLIVADVALAVAIVGFALTMADVVKNIAGTDDVAGIPVDQYLSAQLAIPGIEAATGAGSSDSGALAARMGATQIALVDRLNAEGGIRGVGVATALPRMDHAARWIEIEGDATEGEPVAYRVRSANVDIGFFEALEQPVLAGRGFQAGDLGDNSHVVIVNTPFVENVLGGINPIGRRLRHRQGPDGKPGPWHEVVGLVDNLGMTLVRPFSGEGIYHPLAPGDANPVRLAIHVGDDPLAFAPRLRAILHEVDPLAVIATPMALDQVVEGDWYVMQAVSLGSGVLVAVLLVLAASGVYAILSFSVTERSAELALRSAIGAQRRDIAFTVAKRAMGQFAVGIALGLPLALLLANSAPDEGGPAAQSPVLLTLFTAIGVVVLVGIPACLAPTLRALRIAPHEALKNSG